MESLVNNLIDSTFWTGKKVFLTGHSGFKGSWLTIWLQSLGATVRGYSLEPPTEPSLFEVCGVGELVDSIFADIRDFPALCQALTEFSPDIVIHMAAQPLVRDSYRDPLDTFSINVLGTAHLLEAARASSSVRAIVNVTTDKVYANQEWVWGYRETDQLGGLDPYSSSKSCSELVTSSYGYSFFENSVGLSAARAGNVIGGGDWAHERLVPDVIRGFLSGTDVHIRNPGAIRPWQHVLVPLSGYLILAQHLFVEPQHYSGSWNFGPAELDAKSVAWVVDHLRSYWPESSWICDSDGSLREAGRLQLDISKARELLSWFPTWSIEKALDQTASWYKAWALGDDMLELTRHEIEGFMNEYNEFASKG